MNQFLPIGNSLGNISELQREDDFFQKKYDMTFPEFEMKLRSMLEENFELEDNYLAWRFAHEDAKYFQSHIEPETPNQNPEP